LCSGFWARHIARNEALSPARAGVQESEMGFDETVFGVPLLVGVVLVVWAALGASDLGCDEDWLRESSDEIELGHMDALLDLLGVGRVPLVIVIMLLLLLFGGAGIGLMKLASVGLGERLGFVVAMPLALLLALLGTASGTRLIERLWPDAESYGPGAADLIGLCGTVLVSLGAGELFARVIDESGAELHVRCVLDDGEPRVGARVVLVAFESVAGSDRYLAESLS
jgi:hypothetical protein